MAATTTCGSLYPRAGKLVFELKTQLGYLDMGASSSTEMQARETAAALRSLIDQLDSLVYSENPTGRDIWMKKVQQLREDYALLNSTLEQRCIQSSRSQIELQERQKLLSRRGNGAQNDIAMLSQEYDSLGRSSRMVNDLTDLSYATLGNLSDQRDRMKGVQRKVLDVANRLGLSSSLLRIIERRDTVDKWIVYGGMVFVLGFMYVCVAYLRG
ncbi:hypothetical protein SPRG_07452 [Saprolegnia parasitica CBS 223.65]|uniref:Golgi SNAP receptor complex member 2 n=1 Tax=Saprolegnia parasitica (strain CBS 223.65) TaxID=695850 RepID=A0A067C9R3_SAPPC|nr:hypothetical protein SPRG_07452 [Saprolegnia parasitica CBS 223.65]KDO27203.1 hypothetical protein SPRG_07452 [Saprolegnia parasitica CBS 223.65]|eukprot:XP_012201981.1 hypothetical protein SPRG_07452 [Saprolegnia parasitica CBS 223.65]